MNNKAIFLGSFNPPHKGHYNCIKSIIESKIMERLNIDKIHIIPCKQNPNKNKFIVPFIGRYKMCEFLFKDLIISNKVIIDDIENEINPKYTYDLISYFKSGNDKMISNDFWWIITTETIQEIIDGKWYNGQELLHNNKFIILYEHEIELNALLKENNIKYETIKIDNSQFNYHSTYLRNKIKNGESIVRETNDEIVNYINENNFYRL